MGMKREARALPDQAVVRVDLVVPQALVAQRRADLGREVGDFEGVEDVGSVRGSGHGGSSGGRSRRGPP